MSQISDPQALAESSAITTQGQAVISQSERESATTHAVSAAAADPSYIWQKKALAIIGICVLMKRRLNGKKKLSPKTWILQPDHDQQGAYNNSVRELELYKVT